MDPLGLLTTGTMIIGPVVAIIWGWRGVVIGALIIWIIPVVTRSCLAGVCVTEDYGGVGMIAHCCAGWLFGLIWCSGAYALSRVVRNGIKRLRAKRGGPDTSPSDSRKD